MGLWNLYFPFWHGNKVNGQVSEQRGKAKWLLPLLPFDLCFTLHWEGERQQRRFLHFLVCPLSAGDRTLAWDEHGFGCLPHCRDFCLDHPLRCRCVSSGWSPRCRVCCPRDSRRSLGSRSVSSSQHPFWKGWLSVAGSRRARTD